MTVGPYCNYCARRCFLPRQLPSGRTLILATCRSGMANDRAKCDGHDHRTTLNPVTGEYDLKIRRRRTARGQRVCEHPKCVRVQTSGDRGLEVIAAGEEFAAVTRRDDHHDRVQRLHAECLTDLFDLTMEVAP